MDGKFYKSSHLYRLMPVGLGIAVEPIQHMVTEDLLLTYLRSRRFSREQTFFEIFVTDGTWRTENWATNFLLGMKSHAFRPVTVMRKTKFWSNNKKNWVKIWFISRVISISNSEDSVRHESSISQRFSLLYSSKSIRYLTFLGTGEGGLKLLLSMYP